jgi:hypothetical protein
MIETSSILKIEFTKEIAISLVTIIPAWGSRFFSVKFWVALTIADASVLA